MKLSIFFFAFLPLAHCRAPLPQRGGLCLFLLLLLFRSAGDLNWVRAIKTIKRISCSLLEFNLFLPPLSLRCCWSQPELYTVYIHIHTCHIYKEEEEEATRRTLVPAVHNRGGWEGGIEAVTIISWVITYGSHRSRSLGRLLGCLYIPPIWSRSKFPARNVMHCSLACPFATFYLLFCCQNIERKRKKKTFKIQKTKGGDRK